VLSLFIATTTNAQPNINVGEAIDFTTNVTIIGSSIIRVDADTFRLLDAGLYRVTVSLPQMMAEGPGSSVQVVIDNTPIATFTSVLPGPAPIAGTILFTVPVVGGVPDDLEIRSITADLDLAGGATIMIERLA
jgi:hypothetical protein